MIKSFVFLVSLLLPTTWCSANLTNNFDGVTHITIKEGAVQGAPKADSIQATINGHVLSVVFLENLGQVDIDLTTDTGDPVDASSIYTPNGVNFYIPHTGSYLITFTLENGDEYVGEFEVTD